MKSVFEKDMEKKNKVAVDRAMKNKKFSRLLNGWFLILLSICLFYALLSELLGVNQIRYLAGCFVVFGFIYGSYMLGVWSK